ncbi:MAG: hypothetical protein ACYCU0_04460 [Solirubrobacteraceae bacterium]
MSAAGTGAEAGAAELIEQLRRLTPEAADGYARIRAVVESDGALPASLKALLVAVGACARANVELAASELARARELGCSEELVALALASVTLSRGQSGGARLLAAAGGSIGELAVAPRAPSELDGVTYFKRYNDADELPPRMALLEQHGREIFGGYFAMHHACLSAEPRTDAIAELMMCSLNAADLQPGFVAIHAACARRRGVSDAELVEAAFCAIPVSGVGAWAAAAGALFD